MPAKKKVTKKVPAKKVATKKVVTKPVEAPKSHYDGITQSEGVYRYVCNCGSVVMSSINLDKLKKQIDKAEDKC